MFKFIFDIITDPLRLPVKWYYEWIILAIIDMATYNLAYERVGRLYCLDFISGKMEGSFLHWVIRSFYFVIIWAVTYGVFFMGQFVISHKVECGIGIAIIILVAIIVKFTMCKKNK